MKKFNKKLFLLIGIGIVVLATAITLIIVLTNKEVDGKNINGTAVLVIDSRDKVKDNIINWNSRLQDHEYVNYESNVVCAAIVEGVTYKYSTFEEGWKEVSTTYKNSSNIEFILYEDWLGDASGVLGKDSTNTYFGPNGGIIIKGRGSNSNLVINLNGYKIDRYLYVISINEGCVIKILDNDGDVTIKNGCITGGSNQDHGGGMYIGGEDTNVYLENLTITGNVSGANGGGIYVTDDIYNLELNNVIIQGNYAAGYGGGVYSDYSLSVPRSYRVQVTNKVIIKNNLGKDQRNNLTLYAYKNEDCASLWKVKLTEGSDIYVSFSRKDTVERSIIGDLTYDGNSTKYFHCDMDNCQIYDGIGRWGGVTFGSVGGTCNIIILREKGNC